MAKIAFTAGRVNGFKCPPDKKQAFMWDVTASGLGLRATPAGKPAYVFQGEFQQKTIRITMGNPNAWSIPQAQEKARELQRQIDEGHDPRDLKRDVHAAASEKKAAAAAHAITVGEAWERYLKERRPFWGVLNYRDHVKMAQVGGVQRERAYCFIRDNQWQKCYRADSGFCAFIAERSYGVVLQIVRLILTLFF